MSQQIYPGDDLVVRTARREWVGKGDRQDMGDLGAK